MSTTTAIILVVAVVVIAAAVYLLTRRRRTQDLKSRFGPEYDRTIEEAGGARAAEARLEAREKRVARYDLRPFTDAERERFAGRWRQVQGRFVDDPKAAAADAELLLNEVMTARGYPESSFDQRIEDISVEHAQLVQDYRDAHDVIMRHDAGRADTEDLRQALIHYRNLFEELCGERAAAPDDARARDETGPETRDPMRRHA